MDPDPSIAAGRPDMKFQWIRRRECWTLIWPARVLVGIAVLAVIRLSAPQIYLWLACGERMPANPPAAVVLEGWMPDAALEKTRPWLLAHPDVPIYCTGGPVEYGSPLLSFGTFAEITRLRLIAAGVATGRVHAVASKGVARDRTWASALALRDAWKDSMPDEGSAVWLISQGAHSRRSRLLFRRALRDRATVEVWGLRPERYGAQDWWTSSEGFKAVTGEITAYPYTLLRVQRPESERTVQ